MSSNTLLDKTYLLLDSARGKLTQQQIAEGAGVTLTWIQKFARRAIPGPGVDRVQRVHDYLISAESATEPNEAA